MADGWAIALLKGIVATLRADADVAALVDARVWDEPPENASWPFVAIPLFEVAREPLKIDEMRRVTFAVSCQSRPTAGKVEAGRIGESVWQALHHQEASVAVAGYRLVDLQGLTSVVRANGDGQSFECRVVFAALMED